MKIKLSDIEPNPYRKIGEYPFDEEKIKALMNSIQEKTFWDNILVRPHPQKKGIYQLAYGHHRWQALKKLNYKEIDVPCRKIDDAVMIQIMAEENLNWSTAPTVMVQTILAAKQYVDGELAKYVTWESLEETFKRLIDKYNFQKDKKTGVGRHTIQKFLGGNWQTGSKVQDALNIIKDESLDTEAIKEIPTMEQARVFRSEVKKHDIPKKTQQKIAKKIKEDGVGKRDIPELVAEHSLKPAKRPDPKPLPTLDSYVSETTKMMYKLMERIKHVQEHLDNVLSESVYVEFSLHLVDLIKKLQVVNKGLHDAQAKKNINR